MNRFASKAKYHAKKVEYNGLTFDSIGECQRYKVLLGMQKAGLITGLETQKKYILIPAQRVDGKMVERECSYYADFVYTDLKTGKTVVEDYKGYKTDVYIIKRKMMLYRYGIQIKEVR